MRDGPRVVRLTTESGESTERDAAAEKVAIHLAAQGVLVAYGRTMSNHCTSGILGLFAQIPPRYTIFKSGRPKHISGENLPSRNSPVLLTPLCPVLGSSLKSLFVSNKYRMCGHGGTGTGRC